MSRKKRREFGLVPKTFASRNRWARRGRNLAHFSMSVLFGVSAYIVDAGIEVGKGIGRVIFRKRKKEERKNGRKFLPEPAADSFLPIAERPSITFQDVVGLEMAKEQVIQRMVLPFVYPKEASALKIKRGGGILLIGPPGVGKTLLAKAVAGQIKADFFHIKPSDIVRSDVGQAEARLAELFKVIRNYQQAVFFFDDIEGLLPSRAKNSSTIMRRVIAQYLVETDGLESWPQDKVLLIIGATNEPEMIDPAIKRAGRFDVRIYVGLPDELARQQLLNLKLKGRPVDPALNLAGLARQTENYSGADLEELVNRAAQQAFSRNIKRKKEEPINPINQDDFTAALGQVKPSVYPDYLKKYGKYL